jgi:FkbM family methyltransferase
VLLISAMVLLSISAACMQAPAEKPVKLVEQEPATGLELWQTALGPLWIPGPGSDVIRHLQWEQMVEHVYDHPLVHVLPGDVVIDCGAHIGGFTRKALDAGARMVVAVEPERANIAAFRKNLAQEIQAGRVILVGKAVWDAEGWVSLHISKVGDSHSVLLPQNAGNEQAIEATTLDALVQNLKLPHVDFIKMDIEGSEQKALEGARDLITRDHPRLAISSYHMRGDPAAICGIVWRTCSDYLVESKDFVESQEAGTVPKVLFFYR